jgi:uncharacterized cofD-like protein
MYKKVVVLGGGTGISHLLKGLKLFPVDITAVISVSDDGKSTGILRKEFNTPAIGDIRKVIIAMSDIEPEIKDLLQYRFKTTSDLNDHPVGNLLLTAMFNINGKLTDTINILSKVFRVKGKILPLSEDRLTLIGITDSGEIIEGEAAITKAMKNIKDIAYKEKPSVLPDVLKCISEADLVIIGMGSIYTSILPHLVCAEIKEVLNNTSAKIMYVCNLMTQPGETDNYSVSDHINVLNNHLGNKKIDVVIANSQTIEEEFRKKYEKLEQKDPVILDEKNLKKIKTEIIKDNLITVEDETIKHDSLKTSLLIFNYLMK